MSRRPPHPDAGDLKAKLMDWAEAEGEALDLKRKVILCKLAAFADAECRAWAQVDRLARAANCSERTAQYCLRELEQLDLIRRTDDVHRLKDSTRSVPIYQLAPEVEGLGAPKKAAGSMGAKSAPIDGVWVQNPEGMGANTLHPHKEPIGTYERSSDLSPERARELREIFEAVEAAYPARGLGISDQDAAWAAFLRLAAAIEAEAARLPEAAAAYAADPILKRLHSALVPLQVWLDPGRGRYRGWMPGSKAAASPAATGRTRFAGPAEIRAAVVEARDEAFAAAFLDRSEWIDGQIVPWSSPAAQRLGEIRHVLTAAGAELAARAPAPSGA